MIKDMYISEYENWPSISKMRKIDGSNIDFIAYAIRIEAITDGNFPVMSLELSFCFYLDCYEKEFNISYCNSNTNFSTATDSNINILQKKINIRDNYEEPVSLKKTNTYDLLDMPIYEWNDVNNLIFNQCFPQFFTRVELFLQQHQLPFDPEAHKLFIEHECNSLKKEMTIDSLNEQLFFNIHAVNQFLFHHHLNNVIEHKNPLSQPKL